MFCLGRIRAQAFIHTQWSCYESLRWCTMHNHPGRNQPLPAGTRLVTKGAKMCTVHVHGEFTLCTQRPAGETTHENMSRGGVCLQPRPCADHRCYGLDSGHEVSAEAQHMNWTQTLVLTYTGKRRGVSCGHVHKISSQVQCSQFTPPGVPHVSPKHLSPADSGC